MILACRSSFQLLNGGGVPWFRSRALLRLTRDSTRSHDARYKGTLFEAEQTIVGGGPVMDLSE